MQWVRAYRLREHEQYASTIQIIVRYSRDTWSDASCLGQDTAALISPFVEELLLLLPCARNMFLKLNTCEIPGK